MWLRSPWQKSPPNIWVNTTRRAPPWTHDKLTQRRQLSAARLTRAASWPRRGRKRSSGCCALKPGVSQGSGWGGPLVPSKENFLCCCPRLLGEGDGFLAGMASPAGGTEKTRSQARVSPGRGSSATPWLGPRGGRGTVDAAPGMGLPLPSSHTGFCRRKESGSHLLPPSHESLQTETWVWEMHGLP